MPQESQLAHRVLGNLALPYVTNVSPASTDPHFVSGSSNILTSINGYAERRPGFADTVEITPTTFANLQRLFTWDRFDGTFYEIACDLSPNAQVYWMLAGGTTFISMFTDTVPIPFDFVVSNNTLYFSNGHVAKKWDPVNGLSNWGIAAGSASSSISAYCGTGGNSGVPTWTNPTNVQGAPDAAVATNAITAGAHSTALTGYLSATNYGGALGTAGATIVGVTVNLTAEQTEVVRSHFNVYLTYRGGIIGGLKSATFTNSLTTIALGSSSDTWGTTLTPTIVNDTTFGVFIQGAINNTGGGTSLPCTFSADAAQIVVSQTGPPPVSVSGSAGSMTATAGYQYVYCFGNSNTGHIGSPSPPSTSTGPFTNKLNVSITLTASTDPQVNQIRLFRTTDGGGGTYFEVPTSPLPNSTGAVTDSAADSALQVGSVAPTPTFNDPPTPIQSPVYFAGRIWGFTGNKVWFSGLEEINQGVPEESWPSGIAGNFWSFDEPVQGLGVAGIGANQTLAILCGGRLYGIQGNTLDTFVRFLVSNRRGCRNRVCVSSLGGMMAWLDSANQVWASDGNSLQELSVPIRPDLLGINQANCSLTFHTSGRFHWLVLSTGTQLFVYDVDQDQWMPPWNFAANYVFSGEISPGNYVLQAATTTQALQMNTTKFTVFASDSFHRPNQNPINTNWKAIGAVGFVLGQVFNNQYIGQAGFATDMFYDGGISWPNNQFSQATLRTLTPGKGYAGLYVRKSASPNGYQFLLDGVFGGAGIGQPTGAKISSLGVFIASTVITPQSGDVFRMTAIGTTISVYQNNTLILSVIDSATASGNPGILASPNQVGSVATDVAWDNWSAGSTDTIKFYDGPVTLTTSVVNGPLFRETSAFSDAMNGANQNPINPALWTTFTGESNCQILSNQCVATTVVAPNGAYYSGSILPNDQYIQAKVAALTNDGSSSIYLYVRSNAAATAGYLLNFTNAGSGQGTFVVFNSTTQLASFTAPLVVGTDTIGFGVVGQILFAYRNNVVFWSGLDTTIASGFVGFNLGPHTVVGDAAIVTSSGGSAQTATYAPVMKASLLSVIPDYGTRFSYIGMGSYNEPTRTGVPYTFQVTNNGTALGNFLILTDEDPTTGNYVSIAPNLTDPTVTFNRNNGINLKQLVYQTTQPASRWVSMQVVLANANQVDNVYELFMAYKPLGGR